MRTFNQLEYLQALLSENNRAALRKLLAKYKLNLSLPAIMAQVKQVYEQNEKLSALEVMTLVVISNFYAPKKPKELIDKLRQALPPLEVPVVTENQAQQPGQQTPPQAARRLTEVAKSFSFEDRTDPTAAAKILGDRKPPRPPVKPPRQQRVGEVVPRLVRVAPAQASTAAAAQGMPPLAHPVIFRPPARKISAGLRRNDGQGDLAALDSADGTERRNGILPIAFQDAGFEKTTCSPD